MVERIEIKGGITSDGEPRIEISDEKGPLGFVVGMGEETRLAHFTGESLLGKGIVLGRAASEEAMKKLHEELGGMGVQPVGRDSPDLGRSQHGWTRKFGDNYPRIFGHD